jgi:hypothetical protein
MEIDIFNPMTKALLLSGDLDTILYLGPRNFGNVLEFNK